VALERCSKGHFFDEAKHTSCPHCPVDGLDIPTMPRKPVVSGAAGYDQTAPDVERTRPQNERSGDGADPVTIGRIRDELGIDPVVGWLVCVEGPDRGRDYRIRTENNPIGRSNQMYICISGDDTISRERHAAIITFEPHKATFHLVPGVARGLVYLNDQPVFDHQTLQAYDEVTIGKTKLVFIPFCGERFQWKKVEENTK
jgi:hypothetical protein